MSKKNLKTFEDLFRMNDYMEIDHYTLKLVREEAKKWIDVITPLIGKGYSYSLEIDGDTNKPIVEDVYYQDEKFDIQHIRNKSGNLKYDNELELRMLAKEEVIWFIKKFFNLEE